MLPAQHIISLMAHMYWTLVCKTPECGIRHDLAYMGDTEKTQIFSRHTVGMDYLCYSCGKGHSYTDQEIRMYPRDHAPGPGFEPVF
jgi:hypothetical protein